MATTVTESLETRTPATIVNLAVDELAQLESLEDASDAGDTDITADEYQALTGESPDIIEESFETLADAPGSVQVTLEQLANDVLTDATIEVGDDVIREILATSEEVIAEPVAEPESEPEPAAEPAIVAGSWAGTEEPAATKKEKKAKAPPTPRLTTGKPSAIVQHFMGEKLRTLVLEISDATLTAEELAAKTEALLTAIDKCKQIKVREKAIIFSKWLANGGTLCRVIQITFETLARDGEIVTGDGGNLVQALLKKPYSIGTARAQAGQMHVLLPLFKIAMRVGNRIVLNLDSAIWAKAKLELGL